MWSAFESLFLFRETQRINRTGRLPARTCHLQEIRLVCRYWDLHIDWEVFLFLIRFGLFFLIRSTSYIHFHLQHRWKPYINYNGNSRWMFPYRSPSQRIQFIPNTENPIGINPGWAFIHCWHGRIRRILSGRSDEI